LQSAYEVSKQTAYKTIIMQAGMRGAYHMTELAGAKIIFSAVPVIQKKVAKLEGPF
jgi:hypothetical protein